jgi:hypothetical protein
MLIFVTLLFNVSKTTGSRKSAYDDNLFAIQIADATLVSVCLLNNSAAVGHFMTLKNRTKTYWHTPVFKQKNGTDVCQKM